MVHLVPGSAKFRKGAALAYSSSGSLLLFWVFLDMSPIWPEAYSVLCSAHCHCIFRGILKVSEFKHSNVNPFVTFSLNWYWWGWGKGLFIPPLLIKLRGGFGWCPGIFKPTVSLVGIPSSGNCRDGKLLSFPLPECLEQSGVKNIQLSATFLWQVLR